MYRRTVQIRKRQSSSYHWFVSSAICAHDSLEALKPWKLRLEELAKFLRRSFQIRLRSDSKLELTPKEGPPKNVKCFNLENEWRSHCASKLQTEEEENPVYKSTLQIPLKIWEGYSLLDGLSKVLLVFAKDICKCSVKNLCKWLKQFENPCWICLLPFSQEYCHPRQLLLKEIWNPQLITLTIIWVLVFTRTSQGTHTQF